MIYDSRTKRFEDFEGRTLEKVLVGDCVFLQFDTEEIVGCRLIERIDRPGFYYLVHQTTGHYYLSIYSSDNTSVSADCLCRTMTHYRDKFWIVCITDKNFNVKVGELPSNFNISTQQEKQDMQQNNKLPDSIDIQCVAKMVNQKVYHLGNPLSLITPTQVLEVRIMGKTTHVRGRQVGSGEATYLWHPTAFHRSEKEALEAAIKILQDRIDETDCTNQSSSNPHVFTEKDLP